MTSPQFDPRLAACPLCHGVHVRPFDRDHNGITIDRCADCRLMFMNPPYTDAHLDHYYSTYINEDERTGNEPEEKHRQKRAAFDLITRYKQTGRFLAIGCGSGLELEIARELGFTPEGYDVDPATTREVSQRIGVPVHSGDFAALNLPDASFDVLFLDQVLEHPKDPGGYLKQIHRLLKDDGVVYFGVPNLDSFSAQLKGLQGRLGLKNRSRGSHYDTGHHLFYYQPAVLRRILETHYDFQVLTVAGDPRVTISPLRYRWARRMHQLCSRFAVVARKRPRS